MIKGKKAKMITPSKDLGTTKQAFEALSQGDISREYFNGQVWTPPSNIFEKLFFNFGIEDKLSNLRNLYPHQSFIQKVDHEFEE